MGEFETAAKIEKRKNLLPKILSIIAGGGLVASAMFLLYIVLFPIDVLTNWRLSLDKTNYSLGETVNITSSYSKNVSISGVSRRYIECKGSNNVYLRYLINEAVADRQKRQNTGTGVPVIIPTSLSGTTLPTTCFFSVSITYDSFPRIAEPEYNRTQDFTLNPAQVASSIKDNSSSSGAIQSSAGATSVSSQSESVDSLSESPDIIEQSQVVPAPQSPVTTPPVVNPVETKRDNGLIDTINTGLHNIPIVKNVLGLLNL